MKKDKEKNKPEEQQPPVLSEPVAAYQRMDSSVLEENDEPAGQPPCRYTLEELRERITQGMKDYKAGNYYDAEEVMKDWDKWADE